MIFLILALILILYFGRDADAIGRHADKLRFVSICVGGMIFLILALIFWRDADAFGQHADKLRFVSNCFGGVKKLQNQQFGFKSIFQNENNLEN